jgi:type II secretion system protein I
VRAKRQRIAGTTLAEVLVAVVFLAVAVAPIVKLVGSSQVRANDMRQRTLALAIAQTELENLKINGRKAAVATKAGSVVQSPTGSLYPMTVTTTVVAGPWPNLYDATVTVVYDDNGRSVKLATRVKS